MNLEVIYRGKSALRLNRILVERQKLTDEAVEKIKGIHQERLAIEEEMEIVPRDELKKLYAKWVKLQYDLQESWGFKPDARFHKFWDLPNRACNCPDFDNDDRYPTGIYIYNQSCPVHGS